MNKIPKIRSFILETLFEKRTAKFLAGCKTRCKIDAEYCQTRGKCFYFILPAYRLQKCGVIFDHHEFFEDNFVPEKIKKYLTPPRNRAKYGYQEQKRINDFFITKAEKDIKNYFKKHDQLYLFDESYFLYDRSNIVKQSFVNKINKFLPLYSSAS